LCSIYGKVVGVELINDKITGEFNGSAFIDFESEYEAK
jgi:RNA recognition motif-containing protein